LSTKHKHDLWGLDDGLVRTLLSFPPYAPPRQVLRRAAAHPPVSLRSYRTLRLLGLSPVRAIATPLARALAPYAMSRGTYLMPYPKLAWCWVAPVQALDDQRVSEPACSERHRYGCFGSLRSPLGALRLRGRRRVSSVRRTFLLAQRALKSFCHSPFVVSPLARRDSGLGLDARLRLACRRASLGLYARSKSSHVLVAILDSNCMLASLACSRFARTLASLGLFL
jgi:hypothetical protein